MKKNKKNIIDSGLEQPSSSFTSKVMQTIDLEELALRNIISRHGELSPSLSFTSQLMPQLQTQLATKYKPVISKSVWAGIAAILLTIVIATLITTENTNAGIAGENLSRMAQSFAEVFTSSSVFQYLMISIIVMSVLLVMEQHLNRWKLVS